MAAVAHATNFGGAQGYSYADNANHTFYYITGNSAAINATEWGRINSLNPTDMTSTVQCCSYNADTDLLVKSAVQGLTGVVAGTICLTSGVGPGDICNQFQLMWNLSYTPRNTVGCHEIGHSVALAHSGEGGSCMQGSAPNGTNWTAHDKAHVNGRY